MPHILAFTWHSPTYFHDISINCHIINYFKEFGLKNISYLIKNHLHIISIPDTEHFTNISLFNSHNDLMIKGYSSISHFVDKEIGTQRY